MLQSSACNNCGANLQTSMQSGSVTCIYCGSVFTNDSLIEKQNLSAGKNEVLQQEPPEQDLRSGCLYVWYAAYIAILIPVACFWFLGFKGGIAGIIGIYVCWYIIAKIIDARKKGR